MIYVNSLLGQKLVLIEGDSSSLDKQTYSQILVNRYSNLVLVPSASKHTISSFHSIMEHILEKTIWSIDFFMLCDRDSVPGLNKHSSKTIKGSNKFRILSKYHLENYFLDENIIANVFNEMEEEESWLVNPSKIREELKNIASDMLSYTSSLTIANHYRDVLGNIDIMPKDCHNKSVEDLKTIVRAKIYSERERIEDILEIDKILNHLVVEYDNLGKSIQKDSDKWKNDIPGKSIINIFCNKAKLERGRFKTLYITKALESDENPFEEIITIFEEFSKY